MVDGSLAVGNQEVFVPVAGTPVDEFQAAVGQVHSLAVALPEVSARVAVRFPATE